MARRLTKNLIKKLRRGINASGTRAPHSSNRDRAEHIIKTTYDAVENFRKHPSTDRYAPSVA